jgi:hypothetical protein
MNYCQANQTFQFIVYKLTSITTQVKTQLLDAPKRYILYK